MQFLYSIWKILHLTEYFYTGTAHGARDNYEVWFYTMKAFSTHLFWQSQQVQVNCQNVLLIKGYL